MSNMLKMIEVTKRFPGVVALDRVTLNIEKGEIHALVGENGAGKSTLVRVLVGLYKRDAGKVYFEGEEIELSGIGEAFQLGMAIVHQELVLADNLTVSENIFLGQQMPVGSWGLIDWKRVHQQAGALLQNARISMKPDAKVAELSVVQKQLLQIAKALSRKASLLILDEPTSTLGGDEVEGVFRMLRRINQQGVTIIYISHRLKEVLSIADRVTVLRDGRNMGTLKAGEADVETLVKLMVGRTATTGVPRVRPHGRGPAPVVEVKNLTREGSFHDVSFDLYPGEIVGLGGLVGSGRTDLVRSIFGAEPAHRGAILIEGKRAGIRSPTDGLRLGIGLVPEERRRDGLVLDLSVRENVTLTILQRIQRLGFIRRREQAKITDSSVENLRIKVSSIEQQVRYVSGGNQQKIVLAKWLAIKPKVLILDDPTRGLDVGAKAEIHRLIRRIADTGGAVLMICSEMPEILAVCDRILTMYEGRLTGELSREEATLEKLAALCHDLMIA